MNAVMLANVAIECVWVAGAVALVLNGYPWWGGLFVVMAWFSGYTYNERPSK